ncbi:MAG: coenzyme F420-0:L-glutamate ligase [Anaerolineae bacterium]|nr:coenzyme F420-0:L-glutamate ligase [Anaerolineae bacterium]MDW8173380.1 coenzyme F420-0:L-glutamate ligase [Anaerolineae bacterium]
MPPFSIHPIPASVQHTPFDLLAILHNAFEQAGQQPQNGDIVAVSSKYVAISEGRVVRLADVAVSSAARALAERYRMDAALAQLVLDEADHIFGGISLGFLLTYRQGVISPNAGIDRSNIPAGMAVLLPADGYASARRLRQGLQALYGVALGVLLTDSWLMPGRLGTTGVAVGMDGFQPIQDERGKLDLFGNPMAVTQRGMADALCSAAQLVMGERDEAIPCALLRGAPVRLSDEPLGPEDVAIDWDLCLYVESLTLGLLEDGAPRQSRSASLRKARPNGV